jgi:DNA-binding SARP family transcriptional activator
MSIIVTRTLEVRCLGTFGVYDGDRRLGPWSSRRAKALLKHLVLQRHRPVPREMLMEAFWPEACPAAARNNLHGAVHALRRFLRDVHGDVEHIVHEDGSYALAPELDLWDDVSEFERLAREARRCDPDRALPLLEAADELYAGPLFDDDPYEEWMHPAAASWRRSTSRSSTCSASTTDRAAPCTRGRRSRAGSSRPSRGARTSSASS